MIWRLQETEFTSAGVKIDVFLEVCEWMDRRNEGVKETLKCQALERIEARTIWCISAARIYRQLQRMPPEIHSSND